ncbi:ATP12 family chaperone protein [Erythrobacter mangrovi]|uniref:Molecular chaperone n=1 Tax=Erythrobacter mangrovi TaxID=2739433 RepID=A0A7D3XTM3_9SPHN|nr:ATP12 family protein [Erythrobacter mangrovi]QKG70216.1 molecular chaperone [Erythrobacter mangrovi]
MKRFYKDAAVVETELGFHVALDGRAIKSQGGQPQVVPTRVLAEMMAAEWREQGEEIDPARFVLRDMVDYAIDVLPTARSETIAKILRYAETDTLCYRADPDEPFWRRQMDVWEPLLADFEAREGVRMERVSGVMHRLQPPDTLAKLRTRLEELDEFSLAALEPLASLAASLSIGLSALEPHADGDALWNAANLEEDWQVEQWGEDSEAAARRARRKATFLAAMGFAHAVR